MPRTSAIRLTVVALVSILLTTACSAEEWGERYGAPQATITDVSSPTTTPTQAQTLLTPEAVEQTRSMAQEQYRQELAAQTALFEQWLTDKGLLARELRPADRRMHASQYYCGSDKTFEVRELLFAEYGVQRFFSISRDGQSVETVYRGLDDTAVLALREAMMCE